MILLTAMNTQEFEYELKFEANEENEIEKNIAAIDPKKKNTKTMLLREKLQREKSLQVLLSINVNENEDDVNGNDNEKDAAYNENEHDNTHQEDELIAVASTIKILLQELGMREYFMSLCGGRKPLKEISGIATKADHFLTWSFDLIELP